MLKVAILLGVACIFFGTVFVARNCQGCSRVEKVALLFFWPFATFSSMNKDRRTVLAK